MKIYIIRHADKQNGEFYNAELRHQDCPINENGWMKSRKLYDYFKDRGIRKIIVSQYLRTAQTAQDLCEKLGMKLVKDGRLNEIDNGIIESMRDEEVRERFPQFWDDFFSFATDTRFPEGETGEEVKARQISILNELLSNDEDAILVSHEGYIRLLMCHLLDIPVYRRNKFKVDYCGITELEYDKGTTAWKIIRFNQVV